MKLVISGFLLIFATLWFGAYVLHALPSGHWAELPSLITLMSLFALGGGLVIAGTDDLKL